MINENREKEEDGNKEAKCKMMMMKSMEEKRN